MTARGIRVSSWTVDRILACAFAAAATMVGMLAEGAVAPDFRIARRRSTTSEDQGRVVSSFRRLSPRLNQRAGGSARLRTLWPGAQVIGVSADSQETQDRSRSRSRCRTRWWGCRRRDPRRLRREVPLFGLARRVSYVIGKDRKIKAVHRAERDVESHVTGACEALAKA